MRKTEFDNLLRQKITMRPLAFVLVVFLFSAVQGDLYAQPEQADDPVIITVDSTNFRFSPSTVTVTEGDTVRFFWSGQAIGHNAVEENGVFDSGDPERDVDYSFTFEVGMNGTYAFVCEPHEAMGMVGEIVVEPADTEETPEVAPEEEEENTPALPFFMTILALLGAVLFVRRVQGNG